MQKYTFTGMGFSEDSNLFPMGAVNLGKPTKEHLIALQFVEPYRQEAFADLMSHFADESRIPEDNFILFCLWEDGNCTAILPKTEGQWQLMSTAAPVPPEARRALLQSFTQRFREHDEKIGVFYEIVNEHTAPGKRSLHCVYSGGNDGNSFIAMLAEAFGRHVPD